MKGHPGEYININGVLPDEKHAPPRMIEAQGYTDYIESCDECPCYTQRRCKLIARVSASLSPRIEDKYTILHDCPLNLYTAEK